LLSSERAHFGGTYRLHLLGSRKQQKWAVSSLQTAQRYTPEDSPTVHSPCQENLNYNILEMKFVMNVEK
jgi:hypothetical protein